jgi:fructose 1,6-bisphosphate aldolase/phosphatase
VKIFSSGIEELHKSPNTRPCQIATKKALAMRSQGFIHPATLVPAELEYAEGYKAVISGLAKKMKSKKSAGGKKYEDPD